MATLLAALPVRTTSVLLRAALRFAFFARDRESNLLRARAGGEGEKRKLDFPRAISSGVWAQSYKRIKHIYIIYVHIMSNILLHIRVRLFTECTLSRKSIYVGHYVRKLRT